MSLTADEVRRAGRDARFRLRRKDCNTAYQGARFVDGATVNPVRARDALRLRAAFGSEISIEPFEEPKKAEPVPAQAKRETPKAETKKRKKESRQNTSSDD